MIRKIMRLGDYRAGIAGWALEQTPEAMEMGFSDVVQPCYIMERDVFLVIGVVNAFLPANSGGSRSDFMVPVGQRWLVHRMSMINEHMDARVGRVDLRLGSDVLTLAVNFALHWLSGPMALPMPAGSFISYTWTTGPAASSNLTFSIFYTSEVVR